MAKSHKLLATDRVTKPNQSFKMLFSVAYPKLSGHLSAI